MYLGIVERLSKLRGVGGPGTRIGLEVVLTPRPAFDWRGGPFGEFPAEDGLRGSSKVAG